MEEPAFGRIRPVFADSLEGHLADPAEEPVELGDLWACQFRRRCLRVMARLPEKLIRHPVADTGEVFLVKEQSLERLPWMPVQYRGEPGRGKGEIQS